MDDEGSPLRLMLSFLGGLVVLAAMVFIVSQPSLLHSNSHRTAAARVAPTPTPVDFPLPPLPPPDVTVYYLVDTPAQAASIRARAADEDAQRRAAGLPRLASVQTFIGYSQERVDALKADVAQQTQLQNFFGVRYEVVDLRGQQ